MQPQIRWPCDSVCDLESGALNSVIVFDKRISHEFIRFSLTRAARLRNGGARTAVLYMDERVVS